MTDYDALCARLLRFHIERWGPGRTLTEAAADAIAALVAQVAELAAQVADLDAANGEANSIAINEQWHAEKATARAEAAEARVKESDVERIVAVVDVWMQQDDPTRDDLRRRLEARLLSEPG